MRKPGMRLHIENEKADRLARELAALTGETITAAVTEALREKLDRMKTERTSTRTHDARRRRRKSP